MSQNLKDNTSNHTLRILLTEDNAATRRALTAYMEAGGYEVHSTDSAEQALVMFESVRPDVVVLDVLLPGKDGYWAAREMRKTEAGRWTPIVFVTSQGSEDDLMMGIEAGADDYLVKPVSRTVLLAKLRAVERIRKMREHLLEVSADLRASNVRLETLAQTDALTGLSNRRAFDDRLTLELARARRDSTPLTLMMIDVDHFKQYNDHYGHPAGDACLQRVAGVLKDMCRRPADMAVRYGGEEFALILPNTPRSGAMVFARTVQDQIRRLDIEHLSAGTGERLSLSGGITTCVPDPQTSTAGMIMRADQALYVAKGKGRARFFSYEMQLDTEEERQLPVRPVVANATKPGRTRTESPGPEGAPETSIPAADKPSAPRQKATSTA